MTSRHYIARVRESHLLELPVEAQELGLQPGEEVEIRLDRKAAEAAPILPRHEKGLAIMREIAERHKDRRTTDSRNTSRLLQEARAGAAYGYEPTE
jgi:hypothetical protein